MDLESPQTKGPAHYQKRDRWAERALVDLSQAKTLAPTRQAHYFPSPPALFDADRLDAEALAGARRALVDKTQAGKLPVKELTGATVTVSNLGLSRASFFIPALNLPQVKRSSGACR